MILPHEIGNGRTNDEDEENTSRGASLYLEEATDVSYSEDGMEVTFDNSALLIIDPSNEFHEFHDNTKQQNNSIHEPTMSKTKEKKRRVDFQKDSFNKSRSIPYDEAIRMNTIRSKPYKVELLRQHMVQNSPGIGRRTAILICLKEMGVKAYVIDGSHLRTSYELLKNVKLVVKLVASENGNIASKQSSQNSEKNQIDYRSNQRCLLYQDEYGRIFNIMISRNAVGPLTSYQNYLESFSGVQAMIALTVLCRSFACMTTDTGLLSLKPAYLSLIFGLIMKEEIGLSFLNSAMTIRAFPSVSAYTLVNDQGSDYISKGVVLSFALAGAAIGNLRIILTIFGITGACIVLLSNLGSRSWHSLGWKPISYQGPGSCVLAYICSIMVGIALPYVGHRSIVVGGKGAMEYVIRTSFWVALAFAISDYDTIQSFLVVGSERCNQDIVNFSVGAWWITTTVVSLFIVRNMPYYDQILSTHSGPPKEDSDEITAEFSYFYDGEKLLQDDHASPVGYKVPSLPDFEIDPTLISNLGMSCFSSNWELAFGLLLTAIIGGGLMYLAFTSLDDDVFTNVDLFIMRFLGNNTSDL